MKAARRLRLSFRHRPRARFATPAAASPQERGGATSYFTASVGTLGALVAAAFAGAQAGESQHAGAPLREALTEARWTAANTDLVAFLAASPGECLRKAEDAETRYRVEIGRVAFRSPLLFGGQAARAGLSCNSCHRDGRDNPDFYLEGLSSAPGTADVTSSLMSKVREDGAFNPAPIPSLVGVAAKARFGTVAPQ
ncbi:MAG: hypothetical protein WD076_11455, partial [Parvularculaceae bacterium]